MATPSVMEILLHVCVYQKARRVYTKIFYNNLYSEYLSQNVMVSYPQWKVILKRTHVYMQVKTRQLLFLVIMLNTPCYTSMLSDIIVDR